MTILTDIEDFQKHVVVSQNLTYLSVRPAIFRAEQSYLKIFLGDDLFAFWLATPPADGLLKDLLFNTIANLAMWLYITPGGAQVDDKGVYLLKGNDMWRLSDNELAELKKSYSSDAMDALELLLVHLETNVQTGGPTNAYQHWNASPARAKRKALLLNTPDQFNNYVYLHRNTTTFSTLIEPLRQVQRHQIAPMLGDYLTTLLTGTGLDDDDTAILELVQETMANLAAAKVLRLGSHIVENSRLTITFIPPKEVNKVIVGEYETDGQNALQRLRTELERVKPTGYVPLPSSNAAALRDPTKKIFLA